MSLNKGQTNSGSFSKENKKASEAGKKSRRTKDPIREAIKEQTLTDIHEIWEKVSKMQPGDLLGYLDDIQKMVKGDFKGKSKLSAMELLFISAMVRGIQTGDFSRVSGILDRITGKPSVKIQHEIEDELSEDDMNKLDNIFQHFQKTKIKTNVSQEK